ncbi:hypothetical protein LTR37_010164 [Vermiconidia calcicola]|uniref:Uncharacterized protein n=1 Tax=Vermiconidia calcicola TaxID=1690605 RepID=A0ACC3N5Z2_9PEZI|nr:hypothetical protein LTR37_010164 [Vermiconidia calcicola]
MTPTTTRVVTIDPSTTLVFTKTEAAPTKDPTTVIITDVTTIRSVTDEMSAGRLKLSRTLNSTSIPPATIPHGSSSASYSSSPPRYSDYGSYDQGHHEDHSSLPTLLFLGIGLPVIVASLLGLLVFAFIRRNKRRRSRRQDYNAVPLGPHREMQRWSKDSFSSATAAELSARSAQIPPAPEIPAFDCSLPKEGAGVREIDGPEVFGACEIKNYMHHSGTGGALTSAVPQVIVSGATGPGEMTECPHVESSSLEVPQSRPRTDREGKALKPQGFRYLERYPALPSKKQKRGLKPKGKIPEPSQKPPLRRTRSTGDHSLQSLSAARWQERVHTREISGNAFVGGTRKSSFAAE